MGTLVQNMIGDAIDAFVEADPPRARAVIARDDEVDRLYTAVFARVLEEMRAHPDHVVAGIHIQSVAKWLERMADHTTNIAEQVIFMVKGLDVRHHGKLAQKARADASPEPRHVR